jgi:hypothetical protein
MEKIKIFKKNEKVNGFNFQEGFAALLEGEKIIAATSGWECNGMLFVYRPTPNGEWLGRWEDETTFPVEDVLDAMEAWQDNQDLQKALQYAEGKKLYLSNEDIVFTDVVPGEKHRDGGEYGFYTRYRPIPEYPGIYRVYSETTCDFDACGTGFEGYAALTITEYQKLRKASDEVEAAGSLY